MLTLCRHVVFLSCYANRSWQRSSICYVLCLNFVLEIGQDEAAYVSNSWSHQGKERFSRTRKDWWDITNINTLTLRLSTPMDSRARWLIETLLQDGKHHVSAWTSVHYTKSAILPAVEINWELVPYCHLGWGETETVYITEPKWRVASADGGTHFIFSSACGTCTGEKHL